MKKALLLLLLISTSSFAQDKMTDYYFLGDIENNRHSLMSKVQIINEPSITAMKEHVENRYNTSCSEIIYMNYIRVPIMEISENFMIKCPVSEKAGVNIKINVKGKNKETAHIAKISMKFYGDLSK